MAVFFFAILGAIVVVGLLIYDMDRKRRRMGEILERLEPLAKGNKKFRTQHLRRLSLSIFFNSQLLDSLGREISLLEKDLEVPQPEDEAGRSLSASKRMKSLEARAQTLETFHQAAKASEEGPTEQAAEVADAPDDTADGEAADSAEAGEDPPSEETSQR